MKSKLVAISVGLLLALSPVGCNSALIKTNPGVTFPLPISDKTPAFLFPINLSHLNAEATSSPMGEVVAASVIAKFGATVISGQPLFDLVGNLSYELAETIDNEVRHGTFMVSSSGEAVASTVANVMERVVPQLVNLGLLKSPIKFKYIIVVHSHGETEAGGTMLKINSWGGIYDTETKQIAAYVNATDTGANEEKALRDQLPLAYDNIIEKLIQGAKK